MLQIAWTPTTLAASSTAITKLAQMAMSVRVRRLISTLPRRLPVRPSTPSQSQQLTSTNPISANSIIHSQPHPYSIPIRCVHESSLFAWHKRSAPAHPHPSELEPHLVALFSSIAESQHQQQSPNSQTPSNPTGTGASPTDPSSSSTPPLPPHSDSHTSSTRQVAAEVAQALLATLNPHSHVSTGVRIRNLMIALLGCFGIGSILLWFFRDQVKGKVAEQTADVASRSLSSAEVQSQVNVLTAEVLRKLLNDPVIMANCLGFLQTLFASPETKASLITLLQNTIKDPTTLPMLSALVSDLLQDVMNKPETLQQLTQLLRRAITEPGNEAALQVLFQNFANDEKTQQMVAELAKKAALDVMNDPQVKDTAIEFIKSVTSDTSVQQSTGDAMWNAVKHAVRPTWFSRHPHTHGRLLTPEQIVSPAAVVIPTPEQILPITPLTSPILDPINPTPEGIPNPLPLPSQPPVLSTDTLVVVPSPPVDQPNSEGSPSTEAK